MPNQFVIDRVAGIRAQLMASYQSNVSLSSATKGSEREAFIELFLAQAFPSQFRFGTGDATDQHGNKSGQLDVVVEFPFSPSLPSAGGARHRLYLAESVAAVVEVKSNVQSQWAEVVQTANALKLLHRNLDRFSRRAAGGQLSKLSTGTFLTGATLEGDIEIGGNGITVSGRSLTPDRIPILAIGYKGWQTTSPLEDRVLRDDAVDGILVLDSALFVGGPRVGGHSATGPASLWAFISALHHATQAFTEIEIDPMNYVRD